MKPINAWDVDCNDRDECTEYSCDSSVGCMIGVLAVVDATIAQLTAVMAMNV